MRELTPATQKLQDQYTLMLREIGDRELDLYQLERTPGKAKEAAIAEQQLEAKKVRAAAVRVILMASGEYDETEV